MAEIIVLNENIVPLKSTLAALQSENSKWFEPSTILEGRFHCFCRERRLDMTEIHSGNRTSVRKLNIGSHESLLAIVHGIDPRNYDTEERQAFAQTLASELEFVKQQQSTNKLVLIGDFNMNPYDRGMNLATGINAMMTRECVRRRTRRHLDRSYDLYYNPMWSLFGDNTCGPAGTIYDGSGQGPYGWSMFDQVVISHSLVETFDHVEILTNAGQHSLKTSKGRPNAIAASNHFPILVTFNEGKQNG